jgi:uncharacterized RDD family membrane protein YckC
MNGLSMDSAAIAEDTASVWRRFMSAAYESVILFGVVFFFAYALSSLFQIKFTGKVNGPMLAFQIWMVFVLGLYFAWFWSNGRRTLPMKTMAVKLVDSRGGDVSTLRALARYAVAGLLYLLIFATMHFIHYGCAVLLPLPFFWSIFDQHKRALYDVIAGTRLILSDPR